MNISITVVRGSFELSAKVGNRYLANAPMVTIPTIERRKMVTETFSFDEAVTFCFSSFLGSIKISPDSTLRINSGSSLNSLPFLSITNAALNVPSKVARIATDNRENILTVWPYEDSDIKASIATVAAERGHAVIANCEEMIDAAIGLSGRIFVPTAISLITGRRL